MAAIFELIPHVLRPVFGYEVPDLKLRHGATSSTFIKQAGNGTMSKETQAQYLGHEFHVMRAYLRFASGLLSLIRLPRMPDDPDEYTISVTANEAHVF